MSRLRATTATTDEDRAIATHLDQATRSVESAIQVARSARARSPRARRVERDLGRLLHVLGEVSTLGPRYGGAGDPDMVSEDERNRLAREARDAERLARANEQKATGEGDV